MQRLTGTRVILREFRQEDLSGIRSWVNDYDTARFLGAAYVRPQSWEQTESYLMSLLNGEAGGVHLAIAEKETRRYLGQCGLMMIDHTARRAELAIVLAPDSAGRGYGREAIALMKYEIDPDKCKRCSPCWSAYMGGRRTEFSSA